MLKPKIITNNSNKSVIIHPNKKSWHSTHGKKIKWISLKVKEIHKDEKNCPLLKAYLFGLTTSIGRSWLSCSGPVLCRAASLAVTAAAFSTLPAGPWPGGYSLKVLLIWCLNDPNGCRHRGHLAWAPPTAFTSLMPWDHCLRQNLQELCLHVVLDLLKMPLCKWDRSLAHCLKTFLYWKWNLENKLRLSCMKIEWDF